MKKQPKTDKEILFALVRTEASNLKKHATKEELAKLSFANIMTWHSEKCIYGQMTGDCFSDRATELIMKCAKKSYAGTGLRSSELNGAPKKDKRTGRGDYITYSPIEVVIARHEETQKPLIAYLRSETDTLILE